MVIVMAVTVQDGYAFCVLCHKDDANGQNCDLGDDDDT